MNPVSVLITGANGFVGSSLCLYLHQREHSVIGLIRKSPQHEYEQRGPDLAFDSDWTPWFKQDQIVIHCAARVHVMNDTLKDPYLAFKVANVDGTLALARQAAAAGVKRFIFISSIKVNGESTTINKPFTEDIEAVPTDPYGLSKFEAEQGLLDIAKNTEMEVVIIRPPLMYGPHVKANFATMVSWINKGIPLPLASLNNKRSLLSLHNLNNFIEIVLTHPVAKNEIFLVSDDDDVSTPELLAAVGDALNKHARLFPFPEQALYLLANLCGQQQKVQRLCGSLQLDISKAKELLNWLPPYTLNDGLRDMMLKAR